MSPSTAMAAEPDFELQMRSLAEQAQLRGDADKPDEIPEPVIPESLRPLMVHLESLGRMVRENTMAIMRVDESIAAQSNIAGLPRLITTLHEDLETRNGVSQKLFDALHDELRGYKDGFLLEVLHRPLIRDLILLYDDLSEIHRRTAAFLATMGAEAGGAEAMAARDHLGRLTVNLDHIVDSLLEVLARMDVRRLEPVPGKLDKLNQRVLSVEPAATPEEDLTIAASLKPGFLWRERTVRAEEVTVKKWRPETAAVEGTAPNH
jgi:hypothetical protein